jgi:hypothetical protein
MLLDFCQEEDIQVIVASHAPEMIAEVPVALQTWIDRKTTEAGTTNSLGTFLADLGALSKADAIRACGADKVLFLEGALDKRLLKHLFSLSGVRSPFDDPQVIVASLPSGKGDSVHLKMFHRLLFEAFHLDVKVACITDRDFELKEKDGADNDAQVLALGRKEVENFFLVPDVLLSAVNHAAEKRIAKTRQQVRRPVTEEIIGALESVVSQAAVKNAVRWQLVPQFRESLDRSQHPSSREAEADAWFETRWSDASWRIKNCPGKQVLAEFRRWCQGNFGLTLTNTELTRAIVTCPPDIAEIARKLSEHFYQ